MSHVFYVEPLGGYGSAWAIPVAKIACVRFYCPVARGRDLPTLVLHLSDGAPSIEVTYSGADAAKAEYARLCAALDAFHRERDGGAA